PLPDHYTSRHSDRNCYWLTWGGEPGSRMDTLDGSLSGAPSMPDSFLARSHYESEIYWEPWEVDSWWVWNRASGGGTQSFYYTFDAPDTEGEGILRFLLEAQNYGEREAEVYLNDTLVASRAWSGSNPFQLMTDANNVLEYDNDLRVDIIPDPDGDTIILDWFEVFSWRGYQLSGQLHIPLEWYGHTGRRRFDIDGDLSRSVVVYVRNDSLCSYISTEDPSAFELQLDSMEVGHELWISTEESFLDPLEVTYETPGRIMGSIEGAERVILAHEILYEDVLPLDDPEVQTVFLTTEEVYQEFNGGVRDPQAIRAFVAYVLLNWDPIPTDMILVGSGHYDPRGFTTLEPSLIDPIFHGRQSFPTDDYYVKVLGVSYPQVALSRISVRTSAVLQTVVQKSLRYRSGEARGNWQSRIIGAADDERVPTDTNDQTVHTRDMEEVMANHVAPRFRAIKEYMIFFPFDDMWQKPQARAHLIEEWSKGALFFAYLGHGAYDQLADEGLLYVENVSDLKCEERLPVAYFGSCNVGEFWKPSRNCMAQAVTAVPDGGAILGCGGTTGTTSGANRELLIEWLRTIFLNPGMPVDMSLLTAKLATGPSSSSLKYVLFGDGSVPLVLPEDGITCQSDDWRTGETATFSGTAEEMGPVLLKTFESARPDTYYTFRQQKPIAYIDQPELFYRGSVFADPVFDGELFAPLDADTGSMARLELYLAGSERGLLSAMYPCTLEMGSPSGADTLGPEIEMWIDGFRGESHPRVSGEVRVMAEISDTSGINLLGEPGRQLALYVDGEAMGVAEYFNYDPGSSTEGMLEVLLTDLSEGDHDLELRAADGLNNLGSEQMGCTVLSSNAVGLQQVFVYPNPTSGGTSFNWTQSGDAEVEVRIYSVSGREIRALTNLEGVAGYNQCWWDGTDEDGDPVASGSYVFVISATAEDSPSGGGKATGIIAVVR
ncbi:hypothetical protein GF402_08780, partial [Candidatus Fermentibacteria bacterium]|nr:hypothetical protein [Candidatus Fermentibacteria bacterium]